MGIWFRVQGLESRFLSSLFTIRVPFFLLLSFNKGTLKQKGQKGTTQELGSGVSEHKLGVLPIEGPELLA